MDANRLKGLSSLREIEAYERERQLEKRLPARTVYGAIRATAVEHPERTALTLVMTGEEDEVPVRLTYRALLEGITRSANVFAELAGAGAAVAYLLPSLFETHYVLWGAEAAGQAVPINPLLTVEQVVELVRVSGARILVTVGPAIAPALWDKGRAVCEQLPQVKLLCLKAPADPAAIDFGSALVGQPGDRLTFRLRDDLDTVVAYFHTGGTTGMPKLVAHTSRNQLTAALGFATMFALDENDKLTNGLPLFHVGGAIPCGLAFFLRGAAVIMLSPSGFRNPVMVSRYWQIVEREQATLIGGVPTALGAVLGIPLTGSLRSVRAGIVGAASTPRGVAEQFAHVTGKPLHEILGMTESGGVTAIDPIGATPTIGSAGLRLPYTQLRVRRRGRDGRLGEDCAAEEIGTLFVSGPNVSPGYLDVAQNANVFYDGGLDSGDLAYFDRQGKLFIAGRAKDLIIRGGHNIDPAMIEAAFERHPAVAAAVAVSQPDAYAGEVPACYITLAPGCSASVDDITAAARDHIVERPAWPKNVYVLDAIPLTAVGKVYRPALRADAAVRVLEPLLKTIAADTLLGVKVEPGGKRGLEVTVTLRGASDALRAAISAELDKFVLGYSIDVGDPP
jgi:fatty-acyl-CoA synthase